MKCSIVSITFDNVTLNLLIIITICQLIAVNAEKFSKSNGKLVFANVLFRHGERTPISMCPTDPWKDDHHWPAGWGQLTKHGKRQSYELGKFLRNRYKNFLKKGYKPDLVYLRSSNTDRTIMTALTLLSGMFPPMYSERWHPNIDWQPIPIRTIPKHLDHILAFRRSCPRYQMEFRQYLQSENVKELYKQYKHLFDYLMLYCGKHIKTFTEIRNIYSTFTIERLQNKTLPLWTKKIFPGHDMEMSVTISEILRTSTTTLSKLRGGFLLKDMLVHMKDKLRHALVPNGSIWLYSGHDTTITTLLNTMKMFEHHIVPFAACLMIELWMYNDEPFVEIYYKNSTTKAPIKLNIPDCGKTCSLYKMFDLYRDVLPSDDYDAECAINNSYFGVIIVCLIVILIILVLLLVLFQRRVYRLTKTYRSLFL